MRCGIGCRCGSDPVLLWLCCRQVAIALIQQLLLAWEPPYTVDPALKRQKKKKKKAACQPYNVQAPLFWEGIPSGIKPTYSPEELQ